MHIAFRAAPAAAIIAAGAFAGSAQAQTTENLNYSFNLLSPIPVSYDVLLGSALGQTDAQFTFSTSNPIGIKPSTTFAAAPGQTASIDGLSEYDWSRGFLSDSYTDTVLPIAFQIDGKDYTGTADFNLSNLGTKFTLESVTYEAVAGVPEPAAWAMMILGMGAVGATMRRRRGQASLATA